MRSHVTKNGFDDLDDLRKMHEEKVWHEDLAKLYSLVQMKPRHQMKLRHLLCPISKDGRNTEIGSAVVEDKKSPIAEDHFTCGYDSLRGGICK